MENHDHPASLSSDERSAMKREFVAFMEEHPVQARRSILSPFFPRLIHAPVYAFGVFLILGGTAFAAEQSLPNDLLYPVKTGVIEQALYILPARSPEAKVRASSALIERRLAEAEEIASSNEADAESVAILSDALDKHRMVVQDYVDQRTRDGDLSVALEVGTELENQLEAHTEVLRAIADESETPNAATENLVEAVADDADDVEESSEAIEFQASQGASPETDQYVTETTTTVETSLDQLREAVGALPESDSNKDLVENATSFLRVAEESYATATAYVAEGNTAAALPHLREAVQNAEQGVILIESHLERTEE